MSWAWAGNPYTKKTHFDPLASTLAPMDSDGRIQPKLIQSADETGIQKGVGTSEYVIAPCNESIVHQQCSGNHENIMVMVTICADGTALPPAVIFKGEGFQAQWEQDNPLKALYATINDYILVQTKNVITRLGYSKKGYTDGEIGIEWLKQFDNYMKKKANS